MGGGEPQSVLGLLILFFTAAATYQGLRHEDYQNRYLFWVDGILIRKEYGRLISSGFLHVGWLHFGFNMVAFLGFSWSLEIVFGAWRFLLLYFVSLVGGNLLALWIHRQHGNYRAVGASGAISGVIMASIVLFPQSEIGLILLPGGIKAWLFGLLFMVISIFGIKRQADNIGHEAHLGGAICGTLMAVVLRPSVLQTNWWVVLAILVPVTAFLILIVRNPAVLLIDDYWGQTARQIGQMTKRKKAPSKLPDDPEAREAELDALLKKVREKGYNQLSRREQNRLRDLSNW